MLMQAEIFGITTNQSNKEPIKITVFLANLTETWDIQCKRAQGYDGLSTLLLEDLEFK